MGMAAGAQRIGIYKMKDTPGDVAANPEPFGLIRADGSYRPAYYTLQVATQMLAGATRASRDRWDDVGQVKIEQEGGSTTVLFSRVPGPRTAEAPATSSSAELVDMWGHRQVVYAQDGVYRIELPAAPCSQSAGDYCMIGGPTYYLVQGNPTGGELPAPAAPVPSSADTAEPPAEQPHGRCFNRDGHRHSSSHGNADGERYRNRQPDGDRDRHGFTHGLAHRDSQPQRHSKPEFNGHNDSSDGNAARNSNLAPVAHAHVAAIACVPGAGRTVDFAGRRFGDPGIGPCCTGLVATAPTVRPIPNAERPWLAPRAR